MDCIDYWKCSSPEEVTYFSEMRRLHPAPLFPLLAELMLSLSPREAHFVKMRCHILCDRQSGGREAYTSYHALLMTASGRFNNHLVSVLLWYLSILQQPLLLMISGPSANMIVTKRIVQRRLSVHVTWRHCWMTWENVCQCCPCKGFERSSSISSCIIEIWTWKVHQKYRWANVLTTI